MTRILRFDLFNEGERFVHTGGNTFVGDWLTDPAGAVIRGTDPPFDGNGWIQNSRPSGGEERVLSFMNGDRLQGVGNHLQGISPTGSGEAQGGSTHTFDPHVIATLPALRDEASPATSMFAKALPLGTAFEIEIAATVVMPTEFPVAGGAGGGVNPLSRWIAAGLSLFVGDSTPSGALSATDLFTRYDLFWVRDPSTEDQEIHGGYVVGTSDFRRDTRGLSLTGESGRLMILGALDAPAKRVVGDKLNFRVVLRSDPSQPSTRIAMDVYIDGIRIGNQAISDLGFGRNFARSIGLIGAAEDIYELLSRRFGFMFYVNSANEGSPLTNGTRWIQPRFRLGADAFVIRDNLTAGDELDPEPAFGVDPTLTSISMSGEGASVATLAVDPSYAKPVEDRRTVFGGLYEGGYSWTAARGQKRRRAWKMRWGPLTTADKDTLRTFADTVVGTEKTWTWVDPETQESLTLRFMSPPRFLDLGKNAWGAQADVEEIF